MSQLNKHFSKEDIQVANKYMKKYPTNYKEIKIKTTLRDHFMPARIAIDKIKIPKTNVGKDVD
jgi:hypothetical protein